MLSGCTINKFPILWAFNAYVINEAEYVMRDFGLQDKSDIVVEDVHQISPSHR